MRLFRATASRAPGIPGIRPIKSILSITRARESRGQTHLHVGHTRGDVLPLIQAVSRVKILLLAAEVSQVLPCAGGRDHLRRRPEDVRGRVRGRWQGLVGIKVHRSVDWTRCNGAGRRWSGLMGLAVGFFI